MSKSVIRYANNGSNAGGVLDDSIEWSGIIASYATLRPDHFDGDKDLTKLNSELLVKLPLVGGKMLPAQANEVVALIETYVIDKKLQSEMRIFYLTLAARLPKLADIWANPKSAPVPFDPHYQYVVASAIARNDDLPRHIAAATEYLSRLLVDIRSMAVHDIEQRDPSLITPELKKLHLK